MQKLIIETLSVYRDIHHLQLAILTSTMQQTLIKDLHMIVYKNHLTQDLKPTDHLKFREFAEWMLQNYEMDSSFFFKKIMFNDKETLSIEQPSNVPDLGHIKSQIIYENLLCEL